MPAGCKSNGHCLTGGCNKLNTFNWLADIPIAFGVDDDNLFEISFKNGSRKAFFKNENKVPVQTGELIVVEAPFGGYDIGKVSLSGELVKMQMKKKKINEEEKELRNILRKPTENDLKKWDEARNLEHETMVRARAAARQLKLDMKVADVEFQADKRKATFYYIADGRVDFRELIKVYARDFKVKVEMRQIGARQEAGKIGGIGSCGRELCCSTWLTEFKSVSTAAARYQNLSINISKLSGQCGRLKCCLNFELDTYMEALEDFPKNADKLTTATGVAYLQKTDILTRMMWYTYPKNPTFIPLTVEKVKDILDMNAGGKKPESLMEFAIFETSKKKEEEEEFTELVGHISLESLDKGTKKRKKKRNNRNRKGGNNNNPQNRNQNSNKGQNKKRNPNQKNRNRNQNKGKQ